MKSKYQDSAKLYLVCYLLFATSSPGCFNAGPPEGWRSSHSEKHKSKVLFYIQDNYQNLESFLDQDAKHDVRQVHVKNLAKLEEWYKEHGEMVAQSKMDLAKFLQTQDREVRKRALDPVRKRKIKAAVELERQLQREYEAELIQAVPEDKLQLWRQDKIARAVIEFMESLNLTDRQIEQIKELSSQALRQVTDPAIWYSQGALKLEKMTEYQVLTFENKNQFAKLAAKRRVPYMGWNK